MTENKKVSKCAVCVTNCFIVEPGVNVNSTIQLSENSLKCDKFGELEALR